MKNPWNRLKSRYIFKEEPLIIGVGDNFDASKFRMGRIPLSPVEIASTLEIKIEHGYIYVAGRYNKYSRTLSQTPWVIDGKRKSESSVEELIAEKIVALYKADG